MATLEISIRIAIGGKIKNIYVPAFGKSSRAYSINFSNRALAVTGRSFDNLEAIGAILNAGRLFDNVSIQREMDIHSIDLGNAAKDGAPLFIGVQFEIGDQRAVMSIPSAVLEWYEPHVLPGLFKTDSDSTVEEFSAVYNKDKVKIDHGLTLNDLFPIRSQRRLVEVSLGRGLGR